MAQSKAPPFTLYEYRPSPFCVAVRVGLNECQVQFTPREVDLSKPRTAAFLKRSPFGRLPALVEHRPGGELAIFESPAVLLFLAERFPESSLGFSDLTARGEAYAWLSYISTGFAAELWTVLEEEKDDGNMAGYMKKADENLVEDEGNTVVQTKSRTNYDTSDIREDVNITESTNEQKVTG